MVAGRTESTEQSRPNRADRPNTVDQSRTDPAASPELKFETNFSRLLQARRRDIAGALPEQRPALFLNRSLCIKLENWTIAHRRLVSA